MNTYDVKCPICGTMNHNLILSETNGWMECETCRQLTRCVSYVASLKIRAVPTHDYAKAATA